MRCFGKIVDIYGDECSLFIKEFYGIVNYHALNVISGCLDEIQNLFIGSASDYIKIPFVDLNKVTYEELLEAFKQRFNIPLYYSHYMHEV